MRQREVLRPIAEDAQVRAFIDDFGAELSEIMRTRFTAENGELHRIESERERQKQELALAPQPALSAIVVSTMNIRLECFQFGVTLSYGSGYMKKSLDIKRKPIQTYVARPEHLYAVLSEWCQPKVRALGRDGLDADEARGLVAELLPALDRARDEVIGALSIESLGETGTRVATHGIGDDRYFIVDYHPGRTLVATPDHRLLKWVDAVSLTELKCKRRCAVVLQQQAEERARKSAWDARQSAG